MNLLQVIYARAKQFKNLLVLTEFSERPFCRAKRMVHYGARFVRVTGSGGVDGNSFRPLAGIAPGQPDQSRRVADPPTRRRRHVEALGPPRSLARTERLQCGRLSVRNPSSSRHTGDARRLHRQFPTWREIHHRRHLRRHSDEQSQRQLGLKFWIGVRVWIRVGVRPGAATLVQGVCNVGDGGRRGEVQQAGGGGWGAARDLHGGCCGLCGSCCSHGFEHRRLQVILTEAPEGVEAVDSGVCRLAN